MSALSSSKRIWKGKSKSVGDEFDDLRPIITYRHLYSHNLGVKDPLRVVALCDSDAFYAGCEMIRLGVDRATPLVVLQWDSIIAVNYPARKFGISRMDKIQDAKKRCPELMIVHVATYKEGEAEPGYWDNVDTQTHKVSLDYYRRESVKIFNMLKDGLAGAELEKASIDECFVDFTRPVRELLLERYSHLFQVPPDAPEGLETPLPPPPPIIWDGLGTLVPIRPIASDEEPDSKVHDDEFKEDDTDTTWGDVALSIGAELMGKIREEVFSDLGYSTSAVEGLQGINSSPRKPNNQSILRNSAIPNYLRPMPFQKIRFLGGKLGVAMAKEYEVATVGDLLGISLEEIQQKFGESAIWVWEILRGIDRSEVKEKSALNKSMLASKNLPQPITKASEGHHWIRVLAAELALRLNDARRSNPTLWPKTLVLHARKGYATGRSKQSPFPFIRDVTVDVIATAGNKLWKELVGNVDSKATLKVTNVQLAFTGLETAESGQKSIEAFFMAPGSKRGRDDDRQGLDTTPPPPHIDTLETIYASKSDQDSLDAYSYLCQRCGKVISGPDSMARAQDEESRARAHAALRMEHEDLHFAQDLAKDPHGWANLGPVIAPKKKKQRRQELAHNIAHFFGPSAKK